MKEIIHSVESKNKKSLSELLLLGFLGGAFIALGGLLALIISGDIQADKGVIKLIFGGLFPLGLILVVMAGAELFTGNTSYFIPSLWNKHTTISKVLKNWGLIYISNFVGALFVAYCLTFLSDLLGDNPQKMIIAIAEKKAHLPFQVAFFRAVGCNWLVCLALWMAIKTKSFSGKVLVIWFPIMAFVAMGMEHCIANQFFIPLGMLYGAKVTLNEMFIGNLLPVTLGNIVGGGLFVGTIYYFIDKKAFRYERK
jgi:formate/nitrite transporter